MPSPELKPCPFCGGKCEVTHIRLYPDNVWTWGVRCVSGYCSVNPTSDKNFPTPVNAIAAWNLRAPSSLPEKEDSNA